MQIKDIKDLEKVIKLCRKSGIESIKIDNIEFKLGDSPNTHLGQEVISSLKQAPSAQTYAPGGITEDTIIPTDLLTEEQLLFYSATGQDFNEPQQ